MATEKKRVPANTTITPELRKELDDLRWELRFDKFSDLVAQALQEFADKHRAPAPEEALADAPVKGAAPKA